MGKRNRKRQRQLSRSSTSQESLGVSNASGGYGNSASSEIRDLDGTIKVQIECIPRGSKLKKPREFFKKAFTDLFRSNHEVEINNVVEIKSVAYLKGDNFLVELSRTYLAVIKRLSTRSDLEYALKKINIISISEVDSSPYSSRTCSDICSTSSEASAGRESKPNVYSSGYHRWNEAKCEKLAELNVSEKTVVEILGNADGLGDLCLNFFERNGGLHFHDIESINVSSTPQTITFCSAEGAENFVQKGAVNIDGQEVCFRLCRDDVTRDGDISERTVVLHGDIDNIDVNCLELYFESYKQSGGGDLERIDLSANPPVAIFLNPEDAKRVIQNGLHNISGKEINAKSLAQWGDKTEESDQSPFSVDYGTIVENHGNTQMIYLESKQQSGCSDFDEIDLKANPPRANFLQDPEATERIVENGEHTHKSKESHPTHPLHMEGTNRTKVLLSSNSNARHGNVVEIHGDLRGLEKESIEMYLENTRRSGGGEVKEIEWDATPPRVIFRDPEAAKRVVENGLHNFDGNQFHLKFPVQQKKRTESSDHSFNKSNVMRTNIVEIHGDIAGLEKESLEMYLENERRSGGGEIEEINLDATPPQVIFRDPEAAKRVVKNGLHTFDGNEFHFKFPVQQNERKEGGYHLSNKSNVMRTNIVEIHGDITGLEKESIEMYLENTRRSGGGEIEEINLDATPPRVTFRDPEAAKRVVGNGLHTFDGNEFHFKFPVQQKERKESSSDHSSNKSNFAHTSSVEVHGDIAGLEKESPEMYLENEGRSGDGEVEEINTPPQVNFRDPEVAKRVVENGLHTFDSSDFQFEFPVQQKKTTLNGDQLSKKSNVENKNIVEIHGNIGGMDRESLEKYLENTRLSGGGEIKEIDWDSTPPRVLFNDPEAGIRASSKVSHRLGDISFQLKRPKVTNFKDDTIILRNLQPTTSKELLGLYLERLCGSSPKKVETNHDKSMVMVSFPCRLDWNRVRLAYSKRPTLDGAKVVIEQVPVCSGAFISNIPSTASTDSVLLTIENHCGDDSVEDLDYEKGQEFAFIKFHNSKALLRLINGEVKIEGTVVDIEEYYPSFITEHVLKIMRKEPKEISIHVDGLIMEHLMNKHKIDVCRRLKSEVCIKKTKSSEGLITTQACFSRCADIPNQTEVFRSFYNEFISKEASADIKDQGVRDLAVILGVTVHSKTDGVLDVVGKKHDVEKFLDSVDNISQTRTSIELPSEKIQLLRSAGHLQDLQKELSVTIEENQGKLMITGSESQATRTEIKLDAMLQNIKSLHLPITDSVSKFLKDQDTCSFISSRMRDQMITFTVDEMNNTIHFLAMSENELSKGMEEFKKTVGETELKLNDNEALFIKGHRGSKALGTLSSSTRSLLIDKGANSIKFTGLLDECHDAKGELIKLLEGNAFIKRLMPFSLGKTKAVLTIFKERIDLLLQSNKASQVTVDISGDESSIEVTGFGKVVNYVVNEIYEISNRIFKEELVFQKPGFSRVIALESFKNMIDNLEKEKKVVIIRQEDDKEGDIAREEIEGKYNFSNGCSPSKLICKYPKRNGLHLSVFQGDIAKHEADAIVNPANTNLSLDNGVGKSILFAGGAIVKNECDQFVTEHGSLMEGEVATTGGGRLPCRKVIHAVGPTWPSNKREIEEDIGQKTKISEDTLTEMMKNVLHAAEEVHCCVLAIPAISSGMFGFRKDLCARILIKTIIDMSKQDPLHSLREVHFVNNDISTVQVFSTVFMSFFGMEQEFQNVSKIKHPGEIEKNKSPHNKQQISSDADLGPIKVNFESSRIQLKLIKGELLKQSADVIVNSASDDFDLSKHSFAHGLSKTAGEHLQVECSALVRDNEKAPEYSFAEVNGGKLRCKRVFFASCGKYAGEDSEKALENLIMRILEKVDREGSKSIAMPALGTGFLQFPKDRVAKIMVDCVQRFSSNTHIEEVQLVALDSDAAMIKAFRNALRSAESMSAKQRSLRAAPSVSSLLVEEDIIFRHDSIVLEVKCGDITKELTDAIVFLGNKNLYLYGRAGIAIQNAEDKVFMGQIRSIRPQREGTTELLKTSKLPSSYVAHVCPESYNYDGLKEATKEMFRKCDSKKLSSLSLPAIGTGIMGNYGITLEESAKLILHSFVEYLLDKRAINIQKLNIVLFEEQLASSFRAKLKDIAANPEKVWNKEHKEIIAWFRKLQVNCKSTVSTNLDNDEYSDGYADSPFDPIIMNVYFSLENSMTTGLSSEIIKLLDDHITSTELSKDIYSVLPSYQLEEINSFAIKNDVLFEMDDDTGKIKLSGYHRDTSSVVEHCHTMIERNAMESQKREKEQMVARYVQWKEWQIDGSVCDLDPVFNYQIEQCFLDKKNNVRIEIEESDGKSVIEIDFSNSEKIKVINLKTSEEKIIFRDELGNAISKYLPGNWNPMPKGSSGLEAKVHRELLPANSTEFKEISGRFCLTSGGYIHSGNVIKIERIQNPQLYKSYLAKKQSMQKTAGHNSVNELDLFHGTHPNSVSEINENGFNRSLTGVSGISYGKGVYFSRDSKYSIDFAIRVGSKERCMYLAKVLTGKCTKGHTTYKVAPKGFDSVVDDPSSPRVHVVFYDNQCYPQYLLYFS